MRPLTLEIEGFTAFKDHAEIDFTGLDLFAITGPTGAGKSSIIDALCYALYGRVPRVSNEVSACMSQGRDRMQVTFSFAANGQHYRVLRETRRRGQGAVRLEQRSGDDEEWLPLADRARAVNEGVERIVGLDYDGFTRSVLLPQGQFQEFLAGSPEGRREVLKRLLRMEVYERMQEAAWAEASGHKARRDDIEARLRDHFADAMPENLAAVKAQRAEAAAAAKRFGEEARALEGGVKQAEAFVGAREELGKAERDRASAESGFSEARKAAERGADGLKALLEEADGVRAAIEANPYDDALFAALTKAANIASHLQEAERVLDSASKTLARTRSAAAGRQARAREAEAEAASGERAALAAREAFEEARRHDLAAALRAGLKPGDDCPVCGGKVGALPALAADGLEAASGALEAAERRERETREAAARAATDAAVGAAEALAAQEALARAQEAVAARRTELDEALPDAPDRSLAALQEALRAQRDARSERGRLDHRRTALEREIERLRGETARAREKLAGLEAARAQTRATVERWAAASQAALGALVKACNENGWSEALAALEADSDPAPVLQRALAAARAGAERATMEAGALSERAGRLERDIEQAKALRSELARVQAAFDVAEDLRLMLGSRFHDYLQSTALADLAEQGSRRLLELSSGRYELDVAEAGRSFEVIDKWNADERRSVRTLSGGETFLASLALALALAETLPQLAPGRRVSLESIFLDEGFGALDPEALALAADALDALRMQERFVCVVTHLKEFADRLPDRLCVEKSQSGSSVSRC